MSTTMPGTPDNPDIKVEGATPALSGKTTPMFSPDGRLGDVPVENVEAARAAGGFRHAVPMVAPGGKHGYIPVDKLDEALKAGFLPEDSAQADQIRMANNLDPNNQTGPLGVSTGIGKGAAETLQGVAGIAGKDRAAQVSPELMGLDTGAKNTSQGIGKGIEAIGEFVMGDESLKGLALADKLGMAQKAATLAQNSPRLKAALEIGMDAIRRGVVGAGVTGIKTGSPTEALEGGAAAAGLSAAGEAVSPVVSKIGQIARGEVSLNPLESTSILNPFRDQPLAKEAIDMAAENAASDSGLTPRTPPSAGGMRPSFDSMIKDVGLRERAAYDKLNAWAETDLKSLYEKQVQLQDALEDPTVLNPDQLQDRLEDVEAKIRQGEENVQKQGGNAHQMLRVAKNDTQQRYALMEFKKKILSDAVEGNKNAGQKETLNIKKAIAAIERMDSPSRFAPEGSPSRLQQVLGQQGAQELKESLYKAQRAGRTTVKALKFVEYMGGLYLLHRWLTDRLLD